MNSVQVETSDGTLQRVVLGIDFLNKTDIHVYTSEGSDELVEGVDYTWDGDVAIDFPGALLNGVVVTLIRRTENTLMLNVYAGGAPFLRESLDENFEQILFLAQEASEAGITTDFYRSLNMHGNQVKNMGDPTAAQDAATKAYVDSEAAVLAAVDASLDARTTVLEAVYPADGLVSSWTYTAVGGESELSPPYSFLSAILVVDGVVQTLGVNYTVAANKITLTGWFLDAGQQVFALVGLSNPDVPSAYVLKTDLELARLQQYAVTGTPGQTTITAPVSLERALLVVGGVPQEFGESYTIVGGSIQLNGWSLAGGERVIVMY